MSDKSLASRIIPYLIYPLIMITGIVLHQWLISQHVNLPIATYVPILVAALTITLLEWRRAYQKRWHPQWKDMISDLSYMAFVQVFLARILTFTVIWAMLKYVDGSSFMGGANGWFHHAPFYHAPIVVQVILVMLLADFLRYWLHRLSHRS